MQTNFRNSAGTRSHGRQWTHGALNIFELSRCKYDHLKNTSYQTCHIESAFESCKCTTLDIFIYLQILQLYAWQIYLKLFCHVNKQCLLHEKKYRSKA